LSELGFSLCSNLFETRGAPVQLFFILQNLRPSGSWGEEVFCLSVAELFIWMFVMHLDVSDQGLTIAWLCFLQSVGPSDQIYILIVAKILVFVVLLLTMQTTQWQSKSSSHHFLNARLYLCTFYISGSSYQQRVASSYLRVRAVVTSRGGELRVHQA
jgi:hypothetical protein